MFEGKKPTAEKPLGIQDFLQAECFPAEPEKTSLSPHENSVLITSLHFLYKKKKFPKNNSTKSCIVFHVRKPQYFKTNVTLVCLAFNCYIWWRKQSFLTLESMRALSHLHKYIFY